MYKFSSASKTMATAVCALMLALPVTLLAACSGTELKPFSQYSEYAVKAADERPSSADAELMNWYCSQSIASVERALSLISCGATATS